MSSSVASFSLEEVLQATGGSINEALSRDSSEVSGKRFSVSTDSRGASSSDIYVPLKGERFDGHDFVAGAIANGAPAVLMSSSKKDSVSASLAKEGLVGKCVIIEVPDTLDAYHALALYWRRKVNPFVIGVTGSSGKTTTKEMCAAVFSARANTHKSLANENNEFGVPKTILSMPETTEFLILEMAMRGMGQIAQLGRMSYPDAGIITCAGTAHIELLGSRENIARAKCEILEYLNADGTGIIGEPTELLSGTARSVFDGRLIEFDGDALKEKSVDETGTTFVIEKLPPLRRACSLKNEHATDGSGKVSIELHIDARGRYHIQDAWCAVMAALEAGLSVDEIREGLASYKQVKGRGQVLATKSGAVIIDESYNANPDSVKCAVEGALDSRAFPQTNKVIVLGEMKELGDDSEALHRELGAWLKDKEFSTLITVGPVAGLIGESAGGGRFEVLLCEDLDDASKTLEKHNSANSCIMVKGSNSTKLYTLVSKLTE